MGFLTIARSFALAGFVGQMVLDTNGRWALEGGTASLVDAMLRDLRAEVRLGTRVEEIAQDETGVTVRTTDGELAASAAIVALPVNALGAIRFDPALSERKREAAEEGLVSLGVKVWAKIAPGSPSTFAAAPDRFPLSFVETVAPTPDGGTVVVGFGPSAALLSPDRSASRWRGPSRSCSPVLAWKRSAAMTGSAIRSPGRHGRRTARVDRSGGSPSSSAARAAIAFAGSDIARGGAATWTGRSRRVSAPAARSRRSCS